MKSRHSLSFACLSLCFALLPLSLSAQETRPEPPAEILAQLDFWVGKWEVSWTDAEGKTHKGTNTITRILDGKVIREAFDASEAMGFRGESHSVYDRATGKWKQTWVDNSGNYMDFVGRRAGEIFVFQRTWARADGTQRQNRMVFKEITADSLTWDWEGRALGAMKWDLLWRLEYRRID